VTILPNYHAFSGRHWETGSVCNFYDYRGVKAPHTGQPYSEALLLGISGGIVMGYFSFAYKGYDPHVALLTRNTFDPLDTLLERLGVDQEVRQTSLPEKGLANLLDTLQSGLPAITWIDIFSLPYFELPNDDDMYLMYPVVVYGYDEPPGAAWIADRSSAPLQVTTAELALARARIKKDKFRVLILGDPDPRRLAGAVQQGIQDTLKLFAGRPPRGPGANFGLGGYQRWASLLANPKASNSWASVFPPGRPLVAGLTSAFYGTIQNGEGDGAERDAYADFLEEAALILEKPTLREAAARFRESALAWQALGCALLPDEIKPFGELRRLIRERRGLFVRQGGQARAEIDSINRSIHQMKDELAADFPLSGNALEAFLAVLRDQVLRVHDVEKVAVQVLGAAMTG
jgi:hypothetical protein